MNIPDDVVLQPYGKDEVSVNLIVSQMGSWTFGASDVSKLPIYKENALVHSFIHFKAKNPKYYHPHIDMNYKIRDNSKKIDTWDHRYQEAEAIFFFLYYEPSGHFIAMNYTCDEEQYDELAENANVLSTVVFFGEDFEIIENDYSQAVEISREEVEKAIEALKNEPF